MVLNKRRALELPVGLYKTVPACRVIPAGFRILEGGQLSQAGFPRKRTLRHRYL